MCLWLYLHNQDYLLRKRPTFSGSCKLTDTIREGVNYLAYCQHFPQPTPSDKMARLLQPNRGFWCWVILSYPVNEERVVLI